MLETHLSSSITRQRLRTGAAAEHIDAFADWLHLSGYKPTSIDNGLTSLAAWTDWMLTAGFTAYDLLSGFEACKLVVSKEQRIRYSRGPNQQSITAASLFIRFLRLRGELPQPVTEPSATEQWPVLGEFRSWMGAHRGLTQNFFKDHVVFKHACVPAVLALWVMATYCYTIFYYLGYIWLTSMGPACGKSLVAKMLSML